MAGTVLDLAEHTGDHLRRVPLSVSLSLSLSLSSSGRLAEDVFGEAPGCLSSYCLAPARRTESICEEATALQPLQTLPNLKGHS